MKPFNDEDCANITAWLASLGDVTDATEAADTEAGFRYCATETEWLDERRNGIGASEIGIIMGASTWTSPYALWWRKKMDWRLPGTEAQLWGHLVEDPITALFANEMSGHLYIAKPLGHPFSLWFHPKQQWIICTPDRLAVTRDGHIVPVEIKSDEGGSGWGEPGTAEIPLPYLYQALWQAHVFGSDGTYVVRKRSSGKRRMTWYWVPYDKAVVMGLYTRAANFLASIDLGNPPPTDGSTATTTALQELNPVVAGTSSDVGDLYFRWSQGRADKRAAIEHDRLLSNQMREAMGAAQWATTRTTDGLDVIRVKRSVGKRGGYTVAPTTTDELREVKADGHGAANAGVPRPDGSDHRPAEAAADPQGAGNGGAAGGSGPGTEAAASDPGGPALGDHDDGDNLMALADAVRADIIAGLPDELARLVRNAIDEHPLGINRPPAEPDRGCET